MVKRDCMRGKHRERDRTYSCDNKQGNSLQREGIVGASGEAQSADPQENKKGVSS